MVSLQHNKGKRNVDTRIFPIFKDTVHHLHCFFFVGHVYEQDYPAFVTALQNWWTKQNGTGLSTSTILIGNQETYYTQAAVYVFTHSKLT